MFCNQRGTLKHFLPGSEKFSKNEQRDSEASDSFLPWQQLSIYFQGSMSMSLVSIQSTAQGRRLMRKRGVGGVGGVMICNRACGA